MSGTDYVELAVHLKALAATGFPSSRIAVAELAELGLYAYIENRDCDDVETAKLLGELELRLNATIEAVDQLKPGEPLVVIFRTEDVHAMEEIRRKVLANQAAHVGTILDYLPAEI